MRFLEREVYTFCGKRVRGVMPWARIFLFMGGPQETTWGRRWTGRSTCEELAGRAIRKERHAKARGKKGKKEVFRGKDRRAFAYPLGGGRDRAAAIAALGIGTAAKTSRAQLRLGVEPRPILWRPVAAEPSLSSLYTLDTYVGAQSGRNGWMSVFSSLCIYSIS